MNFTKESQIQGEPQECERQIQKQMQGLGKAIEVLCKSVGQIEERLEPILLVSPLDNMSMIPQDAQDTSDLVSLAKAIRHTICGVLEQEGRLKGILNRLEL